MKMSVLENIKSNNRLRSFKIDVPCLHMAQNCLSLLLESFNIFIFVFMMISFLNHYSFWLQGMGKKNQIFKILN